MTATLTDAQTATAPLTHDAGVDGARAAEAFALAMKTAETQGDALPSIEAVSKDEWRAFGGEAFKSAMDALLMAKYPEPGLEVIQAAGGFAVWLPEIEAMVGFGDGEWRHKDVWRHTLQVVRQSVPRLVVRWGALLHDIGKPRTRKIHDDGTVTFYGHSELGASMFRRKLARRLGFRGAEYDRVHFLILHHLRASQYDHSWTDAAVRRFYKQMGDGLQDLLDLSRADITTKRPERRKRGVRQIAALAKRIKAIEAVDARVPPLPKGLGTALIDDLGLPKTKLLGDVRKQLEREADEGEIEAGRDVAYYVDVVRQDPSRFGVVLMQGNGDED